MSFRTRFAPSPTGPLHLGHAYSALLAFDQAQGQSGEFLLRIEDIDHTRSRPQWEDQIFDDLAWLRVEWPKPVMRQSTRMAAYSAALETLQKRGLTYPCSCNRAAIDAALSAPQEGQPLIGPDGVIYPGTCRPPRAPEPGRPPVIRLNMSVAIDELSKDHRQLSFIETGAGPDGETGEISVPFDKLEAEIGDVVLARRDYKTSYHLSVVVDDAAQEISDVVRGQDLFEATAIHVVLQHLLGLPTPKYHHHALIRDEDGKRLAKRDDARAISKYREDGLNPQDIRALVGLSLP